MKTKIFTLLGIVFLFFSCQNELLDLQEQSLLKASMSSSLQSSYECVVKDVDRCDLPGYTMNFWWPPNEDAWFEGLFHSDDNNQLSFTEFEDGTANIKGFTILGTCVLDVNVWFKDRKDWDTYIADGGIFEDHQNYCTDVDPTLWHYYVIDSSKSAITSKGGDCIEEREFGVKQRPDPAIEHKGFLVGPGAGLFDAAYPTAYGLSGWGWLTGGTKDYIFDFNFNFECPPVECDECEGKVNYLELQYNGAEEASIRVETKKEGENGSKIVFEETVLQPGDTFSFAGNDKKGTLGTEITIYVDGVVYTKIHTSCSEPIGPGYVSGDFEVISGTSRKGGALCPVETPPGGDCDECDGGVTSFTFEYTGSGADLIVEHKNAVLFDEPVTYGQLITLKGSKSDGKFEENNLMFTLDGKLLSAPGHDAEKIHVSCSKPFYVGLPIGDNIVITAGTSKDNGPICEDTPPMQSDCEECDGGVISFTFEYTGSGADLIVEHKDAVLFDEPVTYGQLITLKGSKSDGKFEENNLMFTLDGMLLSAPGHDAEKIHVSCSKPFYVGLPIGNEIVVTAGMSKDNVPICEGTPPGGGDDCNECDGKVTRLDLQYSGDANDSIVIVQKKDGEEVFDGSSNGQIFTINGEWKKGTFGTEIIIYVNSSEAQRIHTSCSVPISTGSVFGAFTVMGGASYNGGEFCPDTSGPF